MNPLTNMKNVKKLSEQELHRTFKTSWHDQYKGSAWIFVGGLPYDLSEGDIICVFSQYGEVVNINLVRDKGTGKQKGFCFICYEDQRSTVLAVDNFNGIKILGRTIRVDHVHDYKMPKQKEVDAETKKIYDEGCGPGVKHEKKPEMPIPSTELPAFARENEAPPDGFRLPPRLPIGTVKLEKLDEDTPAKVKQEKKQKKDKNKNKGKQKYKKVSSSESSSSSSSASDSEEETKIEEIKSSKQSDSKIMISDEETNTTAKKKSEISESSRKRSNQFDEREERRYNEYSRREYEYRSNERDRRYPEERDERRRPDEKRNRERDESKRYRR